MAQLLTIDEAKEKLEIDFDYKNTEIQGSMEAAEVSLFVATGVTASEWAENTEYRPLAKEWVKRVVYYDYYPDRYTELEKQRQIGITKQLQALAYLF